MTSPDMSSGSEQSSHETKIQQFNRVVPLIDNRLGRVTDRTERRSIGFLVETQPHRFDDPNDFLSTGLGIEEKDSGREVAQKICEKVYTANKAEIAKRQAAEGITPDELTKLVALGRFVDVGHTLSMRNYNDPEAKIYLGGVPEFFLPDWVKKSI